MQESPNFILLACIKIFNSMMLSFRHAHCMEIPEFGSLLPAWLMSRAAHSSKSFLRSGVLQTTKC